MKSLLASIAYSDFCLVSGLDGPGSSLGTLEIWMVFHQGLA